MKILPSALKHISENDINQALSPYGLAKHFEEEDALDGSSQTMFIGYNFNGILIEVKIKHTKEHDEIFHAKKANQYWINKYHST